MSEKIDAARLRKQAEQVRKSMIAIGVAMKPAAEKVIKAAGEFEKLKNHPKP